MCDDNKIIPENINFNSTNVQNDFIFEGGTLRDYTTKIIKHYLEKYDNNVLEVADKLDIGKSTIYRMIKNKELIIN
jgi:transcriptional regulator with PAS, ATPase and Fis domain